MKTIRFAAAAAALAIASTASAETIATGQEIQYEGRPFSGGDIGTGPTNKLGLDLVLANPLTQYLGGGGYLPNEIVVRSPVDLFLRDGAKDSGGYGIWGAGTLGTPTSFVLEAILNSAGTGIVAADGWYFQAKWSLDQGDEICVEQSAFAGLDFGGFSTEDETILGSGAYGVNYNDRGAWTDPTVTLSAPEAPAWAMMGLGFLGLACVARRKPSPRALAS